MLFCAYPVFVVVFSWLLSKTAIEKTDLLLILTGVTGATILINPSFHSLNLGYVYALLSGAMEAMGIVIVAKARQTNNPFIIHLYFCATGGMLSLPFAQGFRMPDVDGGFLLAFSALASLVGQVLMNQGLKFCKPTEGSLILMSEVVFVGAGGILIFKDPVTAQFPGGGPSGCGKWCRVEFSPSKRTECLGEGECSTAGRQGQRGLGCGASNKELPHHRSTWSGQDHSDQRSCPRTKRFQSSRFLHG